MKKLIDVLKPNFVDKSGDYVDGYSNERKIIKQYLNTECVIATNNDGQSKWVLIKGERAFFVFLFLSTSLWGTFYPGCRRMGMKAGFDLVKNIEKDLEIFDKELWSQYKKTLITEALK